MELTNNRIVRALVSVCGEWKKYGIVRVGTEEGKEVETNQCETVDNEPHKVAKAKIFLALFLCEIVNIRGTSTFNTNWGRNLNKVH